MTQSLYAGADSGIQTSVPNHTEATVRDYLETDAANDAPFVQALLEGHLIDEGSFTSKVSTKQVRPSNSGGFERQSYPTPAVYQTFVGTRQTDQWEAESAARDTIIELERLLIGSAIIDDDDPMMSDVYGFTTHPKRITGMLQDWLVNPGNITRDIGRMYDAVASALDDDSSFHRNFGYWLITSDHLRKVVEGHLGADAVLHTWDRDDSPLRSDITRHVVSRELAPDEAVLFPAEPALIDVASSKIGVADIPGTFNDVHSVATRSGLRATELESGVVPIAHFIGGYEYTEQDYADVLRGHFSTD